MSCQDGVVRLNNSCRYLGSRIHGELKFRFFAVVNTETFHQKRGETGSSTTTKGVENQETLKASALIGQFTNAIQHEVNDFLANSVMPTSVVVSGIFLSGDELFRVEELTVGSATNLVNHSRFEIDKDCTRNVLSRTSLTEESVEGVVTTSNGLVAWHLSIRLDSVFQAVEFPAGVAHLDTSLTNMNTDTFTL